MKNQENGQVIEFQLIAPAINDLESMNFQNHGQVINEEFCQVVRYTKYNHGKGEGANGLSLIPS
ncbi:MAG TPA: hypothetical protein ENH82_12790 [bacterium]|nr:hypothetical protein [bacterium]